MKRRTFAQATIASLCTAATGMGAESRSQRERLDSKPNPTEIYELRTYSLKSEKMPLLDAYLKGALVPALGRLGLGPVGVFTETESNERDVLTRKTRDTQPEKGLQRVVVLIIHKSAESVVSLSSTLSGDSVYLKAAKEYLGVKAIEPVYQRIDVTLLGAFAGMPRMEKPDPSKPRLFNLRVYESHNEQAAAKKVEMFEKGEIAIFKRTGLTPVFFASGLTGPALPNLTYLLVFPDDAGRKGAWTRFVGDSEWKRLSSMPEYADKEIVSRITNKLLVPKEFSEI